MGSVSIKQLSKGFYGWRWSRSVYQFTIILFKKLPGLCAHKPYALSLLSKQEFPTSFILFLGFSHSWILNWKIICNLNSFQLNFFFPSSSWPLLQCYRQLRHQLLSVFIHADSSVLSQALNACQSRPFLTHWYFQDEASRVLPSIYKREVGLVPQPECCPHHYAFFHCPYAAKAFCPSPRIWGATHSSPTLKAVVGFYRFSLVQMNL